MKTVDWEIVTKKLSETGQDFLQSSKLSMTMPELDRQTSKIIGYMLVAFSNALREGLIDDESEKADVS